MNYNYIYNYYKHIYKGSLRTMNPEGRNHLLEFRLMFFK